MRRNEDITGWTTFIHSEAASKLFSAEELQALCTGLLPYTPLEHARVYIALCRLGKHASAFAGCLLADELLVSLWPEQARGFVDNVVYADPNRPIKHLDTSTIGVTFDPIHS